MATAIDYVLLSANVYGRANDNPVGGENEVKSRVNTIPAPGWELIASTDAHDQIDGRADTGFLAAAYRRGNEIVISYSGTTAETAADWTLGNLPAGAGISLAPQIVDAAAFYLRIWNQYKSDSDIQFSFAGHSLGGGLASLMAVYFNQPATIFDPAPFRKSADSDFVFQELLRSLVQQPDLANLVVPDDFANYSKSDGSITSIESRTARQDNVTAYSIAGEVLSLLSADQLSELGENLRPVLRIALEYLVTHPDPALYAKVLLALGITSAAAAALYAASPLALAGAVGLLHEVIDLAGSGVGRITGSETVFDLLTPPDPDLNWGWNALNEIPRLPDPIDLHSVTLLAAVMLSEGFYQALRAHPELLPSLMSNPDYVNDPTSLNPNLFDMLVQRQANGGAALDVLAADVQKIDLVNGVTAIKTDPRFVDGVYASAVLTRVVLAGLYEQGRGMGPDEASLAPMRPVLTGDELSILFDLRDLGTQAPRLFDDLSHLIDVQSQWRGADLAAADYADATWLIQKGTSGVVATAVAEPQIVMLGGIGNDTFTGTSNNDLLSGGSGSDTLSGMGGNDKLIAYDGDDFLYGGHGNDGYFLSRVENDPLLTSRVPTYEIWDASGTDTLTISDVTSPFNLSGIDDLNFKVEGNDLWIAIDVDVDLSPIDDGRIIVHNQGVLDDRIETLALINDRGGQIGDAISLASIWSSVLLEGDSNWHRVILSDAVGVHGRLVNGPSGNPQGQSFSQSGDYDLALAFEAAKLSLAAYDQGAVLAQRLETLGWTPVVSPSLDAGGGRAADGMPGNGAGNAYAFAASRELPDGVEQFVISFRGSNSPLADPLDWVGNNGSRFGFSYYYQQLQAVMAEVLEAALDAKAAGKQVQLLITGHSLGGGAAQAAMADLLLDAGKSTWTAAEGQATALDASHRIYNAESLVGHTAEIRSLIADTQAITFGAPSLLIDPRKPASPAWTITTAYQLAGLGGVVAAIASSLIVDSANSLNADPTELQSLRTHIWQFEHEDSSNFRGSDPVSSLGTADPGLVFDLNITEALHDRYEDLTPAPSMHSMDAYLESMARALVGAPLLKSPNELEATSPLPPTAAAGTPENNLIYATPNVAVDGAEGNDILIVGPNAGTFLLNGGAGSDTFVLYEDSGTLQHGSQRAILDGPISEATDHLVFAHVGTLSADVEGDNVTITLTSPTLEEPMTAKIIGWYSSTVPFQVASIDQVLNYGHETWKVVNHSFQELGIPYYLTGTDRSEIVLGSHADDAVVMGHLGNDTIDGREGGDTIFGDRQVTGGLNTDGGIDNISGGDGDDTIYGGGSWDLLNGDDGSDVIYGDDGDDQLDSGADSKQDFLYGNAGGDRLVSRGSGDMLSGGVGNDTYSFEDIATGAWTTVNDNGSGFDLLRVLAPGAIFAETRFERAGNSDLIIHVNGSGGERLRDIYVVDMISPAGRIEALEVDLGTGTNVASGRFDLNKAWTALLTGDTSGAGVFVGTFIGGRYTGDGDDVILGTPQADWLDGRAGNDTILGMEGDDRIWGGIGADRLSTGTGSDTVDAGSENDQITVLIDGTDTVDGGLGTDRLSIDASTFSYLAGAVGRIWWEGTDAAGAPVPGVDYGSPWQSILDYVHNATTNQLNFSADNYSVLRAAFLTFNGVENLDVIGGVAINSNDLIFAKGTGNYDGKGGVDALVADLSAMTSPVTLVTGSGQTYNYLGSSFSNFEGFLVSTGDADDYIDSRGNIINNHLLLAKGSNTAFTGSGNDYISTGSGDDTIDSDAGNDQILAGEGDNTVRAGAGHDTVTTGSGDDWIEVLTGNDVVDSGMGDDTIKISVDGPDSVLAGLGTDRLSIDASTFSYLAGAVGRIWWEGTDAAGAPVPGVDYGSPWQSILDYVHNATTNQLNFSADNYSVLRAAFLTFNGVENLDVIGGVAINSNDLIFAKGTGNYDGKGGVDALVADLSAMTSPVTLVTGSGQTYNYLGSSFSNFEGFLVSTGDADDYIDSRGNIINNHLLLAKGSNTAFTGSGNDYISTGSGDDTIDSGAGNDQILAGEGDNTVRAGAGHDTVTTGSGDDWIEVLTGNDVVDSGMGDDTIKISVDGPDSVLAGLGTDRLSIDASTFSYLAGAVGRIWWEGTDAAGAPVPGVDYGSPWQSILDYVHNATTNQLNFSADNYSVLRAAFLTFNGVENLDVIGGVAINSNDLIFAKGTGNYDGKGGVDALVADLSAMTSPVTLVTGSGQTYNYLGSSFSNFEGFLVSTGDADDYIDSRGNIINNHLLLAKGSNTAFTGSGNDYISTGSGDDTIDSDAGNDQILAGEGDNTVRAGAGHDTVTTGSGDDWIEVLTGNDVVDSGMGDDTIKISVDGPDSVLAGLGTDRLSIDASTFSYLAGAVGRIWWEGTDAAGAPVPGVDYGSPWQSILDYVHNATTNQLNFSADNYSVLRAAFLTFNGVENLDVIGGVAINSNDLIFAKGTGNYDGKGGVDALVADLSAMTSPVTLVTGSGQTYNYLGSSFSNFEGFLVSTGDADDYIDSRGNIINNHLLLAKGSNTAFTGSGNDYISTGSGDDTIDSDAGNDQILAGEGDNTVRAGAGHDTVTTGSGDDWIEVLTGNDVVDSGMGDDTIKISVDGPDSVLAGLGTDRLSIDASTFSYLAGAVGRIWWEGTDAAGAPVPGVDYGSPWQSILDYVHNATTNQLNFSADNYSVLRAAFLTFNGVENLDVIGGVAINSNDLIFAKGTGNYDGKGGVDALVADLSAMTSPVTLVTGSGQTYNYLGSSFSNFEGFLVSTGDADDYIDSRGNIINNHLLLAKGSDVARTGAGADFIDGGDGADLLEGGAGDDTLYGGAGPDTFVYALTGNGVDRIQDIASNDLIKIMGASLTGSVTAGTGSVGQGQVQVSSTGGVTTLYVGTDAAIGADVTIRLTGTYAATAVLALGESITVMTPNVAPVGPTSGELSAGREDVGYELDETLLLTGFSDADGDPLRATNLSVTDGSLRPTSAGWLITTPADTAPTVTLNYSVTDDHGGAIDASRTIRFTPVNDAPVVANAPDSRAATVGEAFVFTLPADTFSDVDHDALTYAAALGSGAALPAWLSFDAAARTFSGTPSEAASLAIQISATDGFAQVSTAWTLEISPRSNRPPVGPSSGSLPNGTEDLRYIVTEAQLLADFSDPDGDALHLSRGMGVPIGHDLIANQDGTWSIVPAPNFSGSIDLLYWVTDGNGSDVASRRTIHFDPVNDHPVVSGVLSDAFATVGRSFSYVAPIDTFTDVDSPSLTYTAALTDGSPLPSWLRFDPSTLTLGGTPTPDSIGQLTVGLIGSDGVAQATARLLLIVSDAANQAPQGIASHSFPPTVDHLIVTEAQLLEGYSDPDGDVLQVVNLRTSGGALTATGNGTWLLEAARHFDDQVTLTYAVSDSRGGDLPANNTLHLSAPNAVPVGSEIGQMPDGIEDTPYRLEAADLLVGFTDADGDLLLVDSLTTSQGVLAPVGGGWELRTPLNYVGNSTLTYQVGDGYGGNITATRTVYFIPVDDPATVSSADVHVLETNSPIRASGQLTISDLDSPIHSRFQAQDATAGNYGVFQIDPQGQWRFTARMSYDHLNPGQALSDLFVVTTNDGLRSTVKITIDGTEEGSLVRLGAAPERQTGTGGQWSQAWTQDGFNISHKADHTDVSGVWSPVKLSSVGNANLAGGDIYAGDLGVSGQSAATSSIKQELDGKEAIRVTLAEPAISVTVKLSNFFLNDDGTGYAEAGRLRLLDASGDVVGEATLAADSAIGIKTVTVNSLIAFQAVELVAGGYGSQGFVYGAYDDHGATQAAFADSTGRLHGSDFLLDELEFQFPAPMAPGVASIIAGELF